MYLARALSHDSGNKVEVENHPEFRPQIHDHCYSSLQKTGTLIPLQNTDDICLLGMNCKYNIERVRDEIPEKLKDRNLLINQEKTDEYTIEKDGDQHWRKCKNLRTMLDTTEDIKRRKRMANEAMQKIKHITKDKRLSTETKMRSFNAYTSSLFLYNSETWSMSKATADSIDSFHRRMLRSAIDVRWPNKIHVSDTDLYEKKKQKPWSSVITKRRMRLYGCLLRLPKETPVRLSMREYKQPLKMARGARKFTWKKSIENDLERIGVNKADVYDVAQD